jgi:large subunit ribosomal protein L25
VGTPIGVKVEGGILDFITRELEMECLPTQIPDKVSVDVSGLALGKHIRVSQLTFPENVTCLTAPDVVVAHVVAPRVEVEETAEAAEAVEGATPEGAETAVSDGDSDKKADKKADRKPEDK